MAVARLNRFVEAASRRVSLLRPHAHELEAQAALRPHPPAWNLMLTDGSVGVIAEVKRRSPSAGSIHEGLDPTRHARAYAEGGAVAISVLTEEDHFGGSLEDLAQVAAVVTLPVLRKDFIIDELQLLEARVAGAAGVLLIARVLPAARVAELLRAAKGLGLGTLVEIRTPAELDVALAAGATHLGINSRDLDDLTVDLAVAEQLLRRVPSGVTAVAESGVESREDVRRLAAAGADAVLVGTAVARLAAPQAAVRALTGVPRMPRSEGV